MGVVTGVIANTGQMDRVIADVSLVVDVGVDSVKLTLIIVDHQLISVDRMVRKRVHSGDMILLKIRMIGLNIRMKWLTVIAKCGIRPVNCWIEIRRVRTARRDLAGVRGNCDVGRVRESGCVIDIDRMTEGILPRGLRSDRVGAGCTTCAG